MKAPFTIAVLGSLLACSSAFAQAPANSTPNAPVSYSSISELNQLIANLESASQTTQQDLANLRVEKWKADDRTKHDTESKVESIQKNLQNALPGMLTDLKNSPENLALTFKVYHNLVALYDFMSYVAESTSIFGTKDEFQALSKDFDSLQDSRHAFADRMDKMASAKETEIGQLRGALQAARSATPPKKTVVDDTEPAPKKAPAKKKPVPKPKAAPAAAAPLSN